LARQSQVCEPKTLIERVKSFHTICISIHPHFLGCRKDHNWNLIIQITIPRQAANQIASRGGTVETVPNSPIDRAHNHHAFKSLVSVRMIPIAPHPKGCPRLSWLNKSRRARLEIADREAEDGRSNKCRVTLTSCRRLTPCRSTKAPLTASPEPSNLSARRRRRVDQRTRCFVSRKYG